MMTFDRAFPLPTPQQELLLRAALLQGSECLDAWQQWFHSVDIDALERDSQWLLPLLYHKLASEGVVHPLLARYQNVYMHNWYKNQLMIYLSTQLIGALVGSMPVVLLKGASMALGYYADMGVRPLNHFDVLLPVPCSLEQIQRIAGSQWSVTSSANPASANPTATQPGNHAPQPVTLTDRLGRRLILHWHLFSSETEPDLGSGSKPSSNLSVEEKMRARAMRLPHPRVNLLLLDPTDQWIYLCTDPCGWDGASRLFWFADAAQVSTAQDQPDWKQSRAITGRGNQAIISSEILDYLHHLHVRSMFESKP
jgi:hypothetical protein